MIRTADGPTMVGRPERAPVPVEVNTPTPVATIIPRIAPTSPLLVRQPIVNVPQPSDIPAGPAWSVNTSVPAVAAAIGVPTPSNVQTHDDSVLSGAQVAAVNTAVTSAANFQQETAGQFDAAINAALQGTGLFSDAQMQAVNAGEAAAEPHGSGFVESNKGGGNTAGLVSSWSSNIIAKLRALTTTASPTTAPPPPPPTVLLPPTPLGGTSSRYGSMDGGSGAGVTHNGVQFGGGVTGNDALANALAAMAQFTGTVGGAAGEIKRGVTPGANAPGTRSTEQLPANPAASAPNSPTAAPPSVSKGGTGTNASASDVASQLLSAATGTNAPGSGSIGGGYGVPDPTAGVTPLVSTPTVTSGPPMLAIVGILVVVGAALFFFMQKGHRGHSLAAGEA